MSSSKPNTIKLNDLLNGFGIFFNYAFKNIKLFFVLVIIGVVLSIGYYFFQKPKYEAVSTFILEAKDQSGNGLAGLASQFGFDIASMTGSSNLFGGDNILDILKSKMVIEKVLLSKTENGIDEEKITLANLFINSYELNKKWNSKNIEFAQNEGMKPAHSILQDSVLELIYLQLIKKHLKVESLSKKGSIIKVATVSNNPVFSKCFTERLIAETKNFYIAVKTRNATSNISALERRSDSLFKIINEKSGQSASLQIADLNPAIKIAEVPVEISQRGKLVAQTLYTEVMKNLEASRMALSNQTPVIQLLDTPKYPLVNQNKSFFILLISGITAALFLGFIYCFFTFPSSDSN